MQEIIVWCLHWMAGSWSLKRMYLNWGKKGEEEQAWKLLVEDTAGRENKESEACRIESLGTLQGQGVAAWQMSWVGRGLRDEARTSNSSWTVDFTVVLGQLPKLPEPTRAVHASQDDCPHHESWPCVQGAPRVTPSLPGSLIIVPSPLSLSKVSWFDFEFWWPSWLWSRK